jgi:integrase
MGKLTARGAAALKSPGRHADGEGLFLNVAKGGSRSWVLLVQRDGRRREIGLGSFPAVTLAEAREKAADMRAAIKRGEDPLARRKADKVITFGMAADALLADMRVGWRNDKHRAQWRMTLTTYAAALHNKPVADIDTNDVLAVLKPIWQRIPETASRTRGRIERTLDYAKARGWRTTGENPARWRGHLALILPKPQKLRRGHHRALPYTEVPAFLARLRTRQGLAAQALELLILTAARTSEVTGMRWEEIDLEAALWTVPASRMKGHRPHRSPLSSRAVAILKERQAEALALAGDAPAGGERSLSGFVFPGTKQNKPLSSGTLERVLDRLKVEATVHGFRSSFRDWVGDRTNHPRELAEQALAHVIEDQTERAYRRGDALDRRREMMNQWAAFCAGEKSGTVVALRGKRRLNP